MNQSFKFSSQPIKSQIDLKQRNESLRMAPVQEFPANQGQLQQKDKFQNLQIRKFLKLQKMEDYDNRMRQIVQSFKIFPINLSIPNQLKQMLIESINNKKNAIKQTDILISKSNETIFYKARLYLASQIIITRQPSANFDQESFDVKVFSMDGHMLCSFHNFKKTQRLAKNIQMRFRRLSTIYYLELCQDGLISPNYFLQLKKILRTKTIGIFSYTPITEKLQNNEQQSQEQKNYKVILDEKIMSNQQLDTLCQEKSIIFLEDNEESIGKNPNLKEFYKITRIVQRKRNFDEFLLDFICFGDKKSKEYKMRNQITLRFINYCYEKFLEEKNLSEKLSVASIKSFFQRVVQEISELKSKQEIQETQSKPSLIDKHFPRQFKKGSRTCLYCRTKTKYICIGCSVKYSTTIPLCILCFQSFHEPKNLYSILSKITKKSKHGSSNLLAFLNKSNQPVIQPGKNSLEMISIQSSNSQQNEMNQSENDQEKRVQNSPFEGLMRQYKQMENFVFFSYKQMNQNGEPQSD